MVECDFCGEEFESKLKLHLHWGDKHEEELNSHQQEKVKKAKKEQEEKSKERNEKIKRYSLYGAAALIALGLAVGIGTQASEFLGGPDMTEEDLELDRQPVMGDPDADTWVVEFGDYRCPVCQDFEQQVKPAIEPMIEDGSVAFYYIDIHLDQFRPQNEQASIAAQCVLEQDQDEFWEFHRGLYDQLQTLDYDTESMVSLAEQTTEGIDMNELETCIEEEQTMDNIVGDNQIAQDQGVTSTPTVVVNGSIVQWNQLPEELG